MDLEDKVLMGKLTKQFLELCGEVLGDRRLKHMFAMVSKGDNARSMEVSLDSQAILFKSQQSNSGNMDLVPEELTDISEIFTRELDHIYLSKIPLLRMKQKRDSRPGILSIGLGTGLNIDSAQKLPFGPRPGGLDRSESETHTVEQACLSPLTNEKVADYIQFVRSEEKRVHKIKFINSIK